MIRSAMLLTLARFAGKLWRRLLRKSIDVLPALARACPLAAGFLASFVDHEEVRQTTRNSLNL
jgi:hypothetical protein